MNLERRARLAARIHADVMQEARPAPTVTRALPILHHQAAHLCAGECLHDKPRDAALLRQNDDAGINVILTCLSIPDDT